MTVSIETLLKGAFWTIGAFGVGLVLRLLTNVVMARLLSPELFGTMVIVYTLWAAMELLSDVGINQNIVHNKNANDPEFYNTAWSLNLTRNVILFLISSAVAVPLAHFYRSPILAWVVPVTSIGLLFGGFASVARSLVQKRMQIRKLNMFDLITTFISQVEHVIFAYFSRTIWALVLGSLASSATTMIGSYFLLSDVKQRFYISKRYAWEILHFGKWIFISQLIYFLSMNFDRIYLPKIIPLELFGIYGIARSFADLFGGLVLRLGSIVLFPFIASHFETPRAELHKQLAPIRARFFLLGALGFSLFVATADLAIKILYDQRYQAAAWMLPILVTGSWFSIMANVNESTLLGLGKPSYSAFSNGGRFVFLLIGLPIGAQMYGLPGGIIAITLADLFRYIPILIGQIRERFSFGMQDLLFTLAVFSLIGLWEWFRWLLGLGTSFDTLPIGAIHFGIGG
jgi:O-antigen/teichoic acid export membrane protein